MLKRQQQKCVSKKKDNTWKLSVRIFFLTSKINKKKINYFVLLDIKKKSKEEGEFNAAINSSFCF